MATGSSDRWRKVARAWAPLVTLVALDAISKAVALALLPSSQPLRKDALLQFVLRVNHTGLGTMGQAVFRGGRLHLTLPIAPAYIVFSAALVLVQHVKWSGFLKVVFCVGAGYGTMLVGKVFVAVLGEPSPQVTVLLLRTSQTVLWLTVWSVVSLRYFKPGLLLLAAAATGNFVSFLWPPFAPVDFLYSKPAYWVFRLGVFNLADVFFVLGSAALGLAAVRWFLWRLFNLGEYAPRKANLEVAPPHPRSAPGDGNKPC